MRKEWYKEKINNKKSEKENEVEWRWKWDFYVWIEGEIWILMGGREFEREGNKK